MTTQSAGLFSHDAIRISSFDQKPANGGMPAIASQPTMNVAAVIGIDLAERAHAPQVLLAVQAVDDGAGAEEQQGFEAGVRDHVEDRKDVGPTPDGYDHEAELADGRVGEHPFDVVLRARDGGGPDRRDRADHHDDVERRRWTRTAPAPVGTTGRHRR